MKRPNDLADAWIGAYGTAIFIGRAYGDMSADRARELAEWLLKAADWLDHQSERGK